MFESMRKNHLTDEQRRFVEAEFFRDAAVIVDWKLEGNRLREGRVVIGPWAGPEAHIHNLVHEMGHFVEIDEPRMESFGWGLRHAQIEIQGRLYDEPRSHAAIDRECRVMAFQFNVLETLSLLDSGNAESSIRSMAFMADFYHIPGKTDPERYRWITRQVEDFRAVYTADLFRSEWIRRNQILKARRHGTRQSA